MMTSTTITTTTTPATIGATSEPVSYNKSKQGAAIDRKMPKHFMFVSIVSEEITNKSIR